MNYDQLIADWDATAKANPMSKGYDIACRLIEKYPALKPKSIQTIVIRAKKRLNRTQKALLKTIDRVELIENAQKQCTSIALKPLKNNEKLKL